MGGDTGYGTVEFAAALGHTIKVLRTDRGVERKDLADKAGLSYSHLAAIEAGQKQPSPQALVAIAEALGIRSHELLESVEMRRGRTERRGGDPWWLTGDTAIQPAAMAAPRAARDPGMNTDTADLADFVREITDLAEHLGFKERAAILHLAHKFADQKR